MQFYAPDGQFVVGDVVNIGPLPYGPMRIVEAKGCWYRAEETRDARRERDREVRWETIRRILDAERDRFAHACFGARP